MGILAVGTVALDSIETPFGSVDGELGGSAMYITLAARYFTDDVHLVAVVGSDFPDRYLDLLRDAGVDISALEVDEEGKTFAWAGRYHYDLNERDTLSTDLNVLKTFEPSIPEKLRDMKVLCLGNLDPVIQSKVTDQVNDTAFVICDTMNFWIENTPDSLRKTLERVDCLMINDSEARELAQEPNLIRAARIIRNMGPDILVIKKGEHGALLFAESTVFSVPAFPLEDIQDPTGAGDAFMGGFAGFLSGLTDINLDALKNALVCGSAIGSFAVEKFGPSRLLELDSISIQARIQGFRDLTEIPITEVVR